MMVIPVQKTSSRAVNHCKPVKREEERMNQSREIPSLASLLENHGEGCGNAGYHQSCRANRVFFRDTERIPLVIMVDKRLIWRLKELVDDRGHFFTVSLTVLLERQLQKLAREQVAAILGNVEDITLDRLVDDLLKVHEFPDVELPAGEEINSEIKNLKPRHPQLFPAGGDLGVILAFVARRYHILPSELIKLGIIACCHSLTMDTLYSGTGGRGSDRIEAGKTHEALIRAREPLGHYPVEDWEPFRI